MNVRRADLLVGLLTGRIIAAAAEPAEPAAAEDPVTVVSATAAPHTAAPETAAPETAAPAEAAAVTVDPASAATTATAGPTPGTPNASTPTASSRPEPGAVPPEATNRPERDRADSGLVDLDVLHDDPATSAEPPASADPDPPLRDQPPPVRPDPSDDLDQVGITAVVARALAADGMWNRLLTDPLSGALLDHGRTGYTPPVALAEFVRARDQRCMFPHCNRAAIRCELDHTRRYPDGPTNADNLHPLCVRHHNVEHAGDWTVIAIPGGLEWTSPTGRAHRVHAYDHRPEPTPPAPSPVALDDDPPPF